MQSMTLVSYDKIEKDPRNLAYLFPSMPVGKYKRATEEYYKNKSLKAIEDAARINNQLLIPGNCLHWERKKRFKDQNLVFFGRAYYLIDYDDLTDLEIAKYECIANVTERI